MAEEIKNTPEFKVRYSDEELQEFKALPLRHFDKQGLCPIHIWSGSSVG